MDKFRFQLAKQTAEKFLVEQGIKSLPIDPKALATNLGIYVEAKPKTAPGVSGMLVHSGNVFGILYATHINNTGFQNFSIAHELGHFLIEGHIDNIFNEEGIHFSEAGFVSRNQYEMEADNFAASLLMPDFLFNPAMNKVGDGLDGIIELADLCQTSRVSTAIKFSEKTDLPMAIVVSQGEKIDFCFMSPAFKDFENLEWLRKGQTLPNGVLTRIFNRIQKNISSAAKTSDEIDLKDWFETGTSVNATEEVMGLGRYGKTLTVITVNEFAEDLEDEDKIEESWTPKFSR